MEEIKVIYGLFDLREERELARASFNYIARDMYDIKESYIKLGFHLDECKRLKYYEDFGYTDFSEFVNINFGLDKGALSRCLNVFYRFSEIDGYCHKMWLDDKYKDYSYSQLCEMVSMSEQDCRNIKPTMTVKEIREIKKQRKIEKDTAEKVATSQPVEKLCISKLCDYKGVVLQNYIKNVSSLEHKKIRLFDENGKDIYTSLSCDILLKSDDCIYLRVALVGE